MTPSSDAPSAAKADAFEPEIRQHAEIDDERRQHRQQRGDDHFADRRLGQHVDGAAVVGRSVPCMMPGISRNWRRTSSTTEPAARPTAVIAMPPNR